MDHLLLASLGVALIAWIYLWAVYLDNQRRGARLSPRAWGAVAAPRVSIVLPARNEAHQVGACVASLVAQRYPELEVIVVDDRSEDGTREVLAAFADRPGFTLVDGEPLPEGWMGKSWANHQGVRRATGEWLLFTDADTWHHPEALATTLAFALEGDRDLVTLFPFLRCESFWEKVVQPAIMLVISAAKPLYALDDPRSPEAIANGQYLLIRRAAYDRIGGHAAIRQSVVDDLSLATALKAAGGRLGYAEGLALLRVRMYTGFAEIWAGWSKNLFAGLRGHWGLGILGLLAWVAACLVPWAAWPYFAWRWAHAVPSAGWGLGLATLVLALTIGLRAWGLRLAFSLSGWWALTNPLAFLVLSAILVNAMGQALSGRGPSWKGRRYPGVSS